MASFRKKNGVWHYRFIDAQGRQRERKGHVDLVTTRLMASKAESDASKVRNKLVDPAEIAFANHEAGHWTSISASGTRSWSPRARPGNTHCSLGIGRPRCCVTGLP